MSLLKFLFSHRGTVNWRQWLLAQFLSILVFLAGASIGTFTLYYNITNGTILKPIGVVLALSLILAAAWIAMAADIKCMFNRGKFRRWHYTIIAGGATMALFAYYVASVRS